ncbi:hypothetical protein Dsin_029591 [Dipteronia sinensis]|uniref:Uncharacterized protein n=1 Tax=Dipteronia sinensis TaxID=43782 RepID=A0AAE0DVI4_9ROSI|nr:hypothetical protein Dsin_029591 [Dipteronia sinensis]
MPPPPVTRCHVLRSFMAFSSRRIYRNGVIFMSSLLTRTQVTWEELHQNPESFHHELAMVQWIEKLRPGAEALYILLFENHSQLLGPVVVSILHEAMISCPTSVTDITPGLLLKDALMVLRHMFIMSSPTT